MKKRKSIKKGMLIILAMFIIFNIVWLLHDMYGDPLSLQVAKKDMIAYMKETYPDYEQNFQEESIEYQSQYQCYTMRMVSKKQPRLSFEVRRFKDKSIDDTYDIDYVHGEIAWLSYAKEVYNRIDLDVIDMCEANFDGCTYSYEYDAVDEQIRKDFYEGNNIDDKEILNIQAVYVTENSKEIEMMVHQFQKLYEIFKDSNVPMKSYTIYFYDAEDSYVFGIHNVTKEVLLNKDFPQKLEVAMKDLNHYREQDGFYVEILEEN